MITDFGMRDYFVGHIRAVLAGSAPEVKVIDLTHGIEPFAVSEGAWTVEVSLPFVSPESVVLGIVDPGVGGQRRPIAVRSTDGKICVGPDNGLFAGVLPHESRRSGTVELTDLGVEARILEPEALGLAPHNVSATFEGRDLFAPAAAALARGLPFDAVGPPAGYMTSLPSFTATPSNTGLQGEVIHIDRFGTLITTVRASQVLGRASFHLELSGGRVSIGARTFEDIPAGMLNWIVDSSGFVAIAANRGSAAEELGARRGDSVEVVWNE